MPSGTVKCFNATKGYGFIQPDGGGSGKESAENLKVTWWRLFSATVRPNAAIAHLGKVVPKADHNMPAVLTASEMLTTAGEDSGPVEFARIAILKALTAMPSEASIPTARP
jgi:hypothetical protein